ncbi:MAG: DHH family phosphoesterase [Candidatus ainarchaeum sp.]|nr:DHH family phosphoesterase [Candidatus ainarchaeum sp.]
MISSKFDFKVFKNKKVLLLTHEHADLDAFCSAAIFNKILNQNKIKSVVAVPSHINEQTTDFAKNYGVDFVRKPIIINYDYLFLFDLNDFHQLGGIEEQFANLDLNFIKNNVFVFDHHDTKIKLKIKKENLFINKNAFSTTQILYDLFSNLFDRDMFFYCALGLIEDTGLFLTGSAKFFEIFSICLSNSKKSYSELLYVAKPKSNRGEKIAFLKSLQTLKVYKIGEIVVVSARVSFFQSVIATKLLEFADITLVAGKENKLVNMSLRAESYFKEKNNFNLINDLLTPLQKEIGGVIGGHSGAAQWKGNFNEEKLIEKSIFILRKKFN